MNAPELKPNRLPRAWKSKFGLRDKSVIKPDPDDVAADFRRSEPRRWSRGTAGYLVYQIACGAQIKMEIFELRGEPFGERILEACSGRPSGTVGRNRNLKMLVRLSRLLKQMTAHRRLPSHRSRKKTNGPMRSQIGRERWQASANSSAERHQTYPRRQQSYHSGFDWHGGN